MNGNDILNPLVSIIINCYNGEEFLKETISSIYDQTYKNWEIIFWDNCSTDKSSKIAKSFDKKVKYFYSKNNFSLGKARNLALNKVTGKYIAFIDCDDVWFDKNKLKNQVFFMESNLEFALSYDGLEEIFLDGTHFQFVNNVHKSGFILENLLFQFDIPIVSSILRKSHLSDSGLSFDESITASEEYCLFMQLAARYPIGVSSKITTKYRIDPNSLTSKSLAVLGKERRYTLNKILNDFPEYKLKYKFAFKEAYARSDYYDARFFMKNGFRFKAFKSLVPNIFISYKYFLLVILSLFPVFVWNYIHIKYKNRV